MKRHTPDSCPNVHLEQIAKIAQNARTSWFGLLALLVFVGVTLMGHEDSDFFAFGAETELPLVNISVPTVSFFVSAPALTAALYVYLHIYLHGLWVALARCPARMDRGPLEERVYPTMLCTSALVLRRWVRRESGKPVEGSRGATVAISILMVWLLGPVVLGALWWRSMPYHNEWLTLWAASWLWLALIAGGTNLFQLFYVMRSSAIYPYGLFRRPLARPELILSVELLIILTMFSWDRTEGGRFHFPVPADLTGTELSHKPANWLHYDIWLEDWEHTFRKRECPTAVDSGGSCPENKLNPFRRETKQRWAALTQSLDAPNLQGADLRSAILLRAFLSGADLSLVRFGDEATLLGARLEGTDLSQARFGDGANLSLARLEGANLRETKFGNEANLSGAEFGDGANLFGIRFGDDANIGFTWLEGADILDDKLEFYDSRGADLGVVEFLKIAWESDPNRVKMDISTFLWAGVGRGADLRRVGSDAANLRWARFGDDADLRQAEFGNDATFLGVEFGDNATFRDAEFGDGANFRLARFGHGADLRWVRFSDGADLSEARFGRDTSFADAQLQDADLSGAVFDDGTIFRRTGLRGANLHETRFGDSASFAHAQLQGINFSAAQFGDRAYFFSAQLQHADLSGTRFGGDANFLNAQLQHADLSGTRFGGDATFLNAQLQHADLSGAYLEDANLGAAQLEGADLSGTQLEGADLSGTRLEGADLRDADGLIQSQLDLACGDQHTKLSHGLSIPTCAD